MTKTVYQVLTSVIIVIWCVNADCNIQPVIANAQSNITGSPPYPENTVARYDCNVGYTTSGTSRFYTCNNTEWIGGNILCEMIYCSYVAPPENGKILNTPNNEVGTSINFACNEGYDISGANTMLCRTDGLWSPATPPVCTAKDCGEFGSIQYASVFQENSEGERNHYGSVAEVTCQYGRVLNGPPRVKCEANGQWGERPTCELLQCPPYPNSNASCVSQSILRGDFYFLVCKDDISTRTGDDLAQCIQGQWDTVEMACFCDCKVHDYDSSLINVVNLNQFGNLPHHQKLEWKCLGRSSAPQNNYVIQCTDGKLEVLKDGVEIDVIDTVDLSYMPSANNTFFSEICIQTTSKETSPSTNSITKDNVSDNTTEAGTNKITTFKMNSSAACYANTFLICVASYLVILQ